MSKYSQFIDSIDQSQRSLKQFGFIVGGIFVFIALIMDVSNGHVWLKTSFIFAGISLLVLGLIRPNLLRYPYLAWMFLGFLLSLIVAPVVLALIYYLFFSPIAVIKRAFSANDSWVRYDKESKSYWRVNSEEYEKTQSENLY